MSVHSASAEIHPGRVAPIARLPIFLVLDGKRAMLAGGGAAAAWKAELLSAVARTSTSMPTKFQKSCTRSPLLRRAARSFCIGVHGSRAI